MGCAKTTHKVNADNQLRLAPIAAFYFCDSSVCLRAMWNLLLTVAIGLLCHAVARRASGWRLAVHWLSVTHVCVDLGRGQRTVGTRCCRVLGWGAERLVRVLVGWGTTGGLLLCVLSTRVHGMRGRRGGRSRGGGGGLAGGRCGLGSGDGDARVD